MNDGVETLLAANMNSLYAFCKIHFARFRFTADASPFSRLSFFLLLRPFSFGLPSPASRAHLAQAHTKPYSASSARRSCTFARSLESIYEIVTWLG